jgi:hypothetical protein
MAVETARDIYQLVDVLKRLWPVVGFMVINVGLFSRCRQPASALISAPLLSASAMARPAFPGAANPQSIALDCFRSPGLPANGMPTLAAVAKHAAPLSYSLHAF